MSDTAAWDQEIVTSEHDGAEPAGPAQAAASWLRQFEDALASCDLSRLEDLFVADCWWRDILAITWDLQTARGFDQIRNKFADGLSAAGFKDLALDPANPPTEADGVITAFYTFATAVARGRGIVRLQNGSDGAVRAWTVLTKVEELIGHEERRTSVHDAAREAHNEPVSGRLTWPEKREREREFADTDPDVVVIGAGHAGLTVAARLGHLGVSTLVVEKSQRLGDVWRLRYNNLSLHDTKWYGQMPYLPYPDNWPVFAPKELIADWFEAYAWILQINVWTSSEARRADYDETTGRWTVRIDRDGTERVLHPKHVVFATGAFSGDPTIPAIDGIEEFGGEAIHSSAHHGGRDLAGKNVVVVGTGASAHDVAQDAYEQGAHVTMVQRGPTYVVSSRFGVPAMHEALYSETSPPVDDADLIALSTPWNLFLEIAGPSVEALAEIDKELLDGLRSAGFQLTNGINGSGLFGLSLTRGGGYYIDKGCSQLIIDRKIELQHGEITRFTPTGVTYSDGTTADADVVVFATGWPNMRDTIRPIIGDEVADQLTPVWGLDEQGEIQGTFRPTGHPRLWYMAGGFQQSRYGSKILALQIKAVEAGLKN
ncbi:NAD(P)/FAD-dependent oxidoreductase [Rhodococcus rhodochrous]|uniref:flavin-containing monooxygenase n=1 Tax=Rhodococcus rhodochrous TaxID=1829 RepID=UPI001E5A77C0|nr:NAD(P)/FAD-dependent oxidoreductase [Rhodococcus rhodochrous]MCB8913752.1 NAD(P)/FAD-dependent oxidoreductase [Rhodococcus rhodochrous]